MKFTCTVEINRPIDEVIKLFNNPDNLKEWQDGFQSFEHLEGTPGTPGAKSRLLYKQGKREMELIETLKVYNLPEEMSAIYTHKHMENQMTNRFTALDDNRTRYDAYIDYVKLNGFMLKVIAFLMPGMFQKQTQKWLNQFKDFAERAE